MKIERVRLHNFRRFADATFSFHPQLTVLIGDNGFGKTTVLDALAVMLGTYLQKFSVISGRGPIKKSDSRTLIYEKDDLVTAEPQLPTFLRAEGWLQGQTVAWQRNPRDRGGNAKELLC